MIKTTLEREVAALCCVMPPPQSPSTCGPSFVHRCANRDESAAVLLAGVADMGERCVLTINRILWVPADCYVERTPDHLKVTSTGWMRALKAAERLDLHPIFFHTHPHYTMSESFPSRRPGRRSSCSSHSQIRAGVSALREHDPRRQARALRRSQVGSSKTDKPHQHQAPENRGTPSPDPSEHRPSRRFNAAHRGGARPADPRVRKSRTASPLPPACRCGRAPAAPAPRLSSNSHDSVWVTSPS